MAGRAGRDLLLRHALAGPGQPRAAPRCRSAALVVVLLALQRAYLRTPPRGSLGRDTLIGGALALLATLLLAGLGTRAGPAPARRPARRLPRLSGDARRSRGRRSPTASAPVPRRGWRARNAQASVDRGPRRTGHRTRRGGPRGGGARPHPPLRPRPDDRRQRARRGPRRPAGRQSSTSCCAAAARALLGLRERRCVAARRRARCRPSAPVQERCTEVIVADPSRVGGTAAAGALADASDRMANSLDTLISELRRQLGPMPRSSVQGRDGIFADLAAFTALPRLTGLALSVDGTRLVAAMQQPDAKGGALHVLALGDPAGRGEPARLTYSAKGESAPAFRPDGSPAVHLGPSRPGRRRRRRRRSRAVVLPRPASRAWWPAVPAASAARWSPPPPAASSLVGEPAASTPPTTTTSAGAPARKDRKISAILHTGMPIRYWDHELGR